MTLFDISPPVTSLSALFPGDVPLQRTIQYELKRGHSVNLSSFSGSVHLGAHADAPYHYCETGETIEAVPLEPYLGPCNVVTVRDTSLIEPAHCLDVLKQKPQRLLFRTLSLKDPNRFQTDFAAFSAATVELLGESGVKLIGIDTPSLDPAESKDLPAHHALLRMKMYNLENLWLEHVPDGQYELIALPLRLVGFDASPVRAILRKF